MNAYPEVSKMNMFGKKKRRKEETINKINCDHGDKKQRYSNGGIKRETSTSQCLKLFQ